MRRLGLLTFVFVAAASTSAAAAGTEITWLGHAAFQITSPAGTQILVDPFITGNPKTPAAMKSLKRYKPAAVLVTHSHQDHAGDVVALAKANGCPVIGAFDHISALPIPDGQKQGGNVGGTIVVKDLEVHLVPAMHGSSPGGRPIGFVIKVKNGPSIYHTGDTWIFSDMALIQQIHKPTVVLLNTGGGPYTQNPKVARLATKKFLKPRVIVPMHFGTFPPLATADDVRAAFRGDKRLRLLEPGQSTTIKLKK